MTTISEILTALGLLLGGTCIGIMVGLLFWDWWARRRSTVILSREDV